MSLVLRRHDIVFAKFFLHALFSYLLINQFYLAAIDELGGDPVKSITHFTGMGALNLLLVTLSISPLSKIFKIRQFVKFRRLIGLYSFVYAITHILCFLFFEVQFDIIFFFEEVINRPYILVGMSAFLILMVLALTSFSLLKRRLGAKWQTLHNMVYLATFLVTIHFLWSVKLNVVEPVIYIVLLVLLMIPRRRKVISMVSKIKKS